MVRTIMTALQEKVTSPIRPKAMMAQPMSSRPGREPRYTSKPLTGTKKSTMIRAQKARL